LRSAHRFASLPTPNRKPLLAFSTHVCNKRLAACCVHVACSGKVLEGVSVDHVAAMGEDVSGSRLLEVVLQV
jgi:hypothetical protein